MPGFLGALGALGSLMPGYIQGREAAIKGNWQDAEKFNTVRLGQLQNLFTEETYPLAYNRAVDDASISRMATQEHALNQYLPTVATAPWRLATAMATAQGQLALVPNAIRTQASNLGTQMSNNAYQQNANAFGLQNMQNQALQNEQFNAFMQQLWPQYQQFLQQNAQQQQQQQGSTTANSGAPTAATEENIRQGLNP